MVLSSSKKIFVVNYDEGRTSNPTIAVSGTNEELADAYVSLACLREEIDELKQLMTSIQTDIAELKNAQQAKLESSTIGDNSNVSTSMQGDHSVKTKVFVNNKHKGDDTVGISTEIHRAYQILQSDGEML